MIKEPFKIEIITAIKRILNLAQLKSPFYIYYNFSTPVDWLDEGRSISKNNTYKYSCEALKSQHFITIFITMLAHTSIGQMRVVQY